MSALISQIVSITNPSDFPPPIPAARHVANLNPISTYAEFVARHDALQAGWDDDDRRKMRVEGEDEL